MVQTSSVENHPTNIVAPPKTKATALAAQKAGYHASTSSTSTSVLKDRLLLSLSGGSHQEVVKGASCNKRVINTGNHHPPNLSNGVQSTVAKPVQPHNNTIIAYYDPATNEPAITVVGSQNLKAALAGRSIKVQKAKSKESFEGNYSIADERRPASSKQKVLATLPEPILKGSRKGGGLLVKDGGSHIKKKVAFGGSNGEQVTIYFYEAVHVDAPWTGPKVSGKFGTKEQTGLALRKNRLPEQALSFRMM